MLKHIFPALTAIAVLVFALNYTAISNSWFGHWFAETGGYLLFIGIPVFILTMLAYNIQASIKQAANRTLASKVADAKANQTIEQQQTPQ